MAKTYKQPTACKDLAPVVIIYTMKMAHNIYKGGNNVEEKEGILAKVMEAKDSTKGIYGIVVHSTNGRNNKLCYFKRKNQKLEALCS